ncbi:MAG: amidohydrolase family protein, partial [Gemmatimonadota bacterium]
MSATQDLLLREYVPRSELVVDEHSVDRARFPVVDAHVHLGRLHDAGPEAVQALVDDMDACNVRAYVDLDGGRRHPIGEAVARLKQAHPGRFYVLTVLPWDQIAPAGGDIGAKLAAALAEAVQQGADGLKIHKSLGLRIRDEQGRLIMPHDERLGPLFDKCGQLGVPCLFHVADPVAFFRPLDRYNERWEELSAHPDWHFCGGDYPTFEALMESQERLLEAHPGTRFQSAHVASYSENLAWVSRLLDRYPNLYVDISARIGELGRQ